jgi:hypothetical protein
MRHFQKKREREREREREKEIEWLEQQCSGSSCIIWAVTAARPYQRRREIDRWIEIERELAGRQAGRRAGGQAGSDVYHYDCRAVRWTLLLAAMMCVRCWLPL